VRPINRVAAGVILVGAGLSLVGTFLPWVTATGFGISASKAGIQGDGIFLAGLALVIGLVGVLLLRRPAGRTPVKWVGGLAILGGALLIYEFSQVSAHVNSVNASSKLIQADVGIGLYVAGLGTLVALVGAAMAWPRTQQVAIVAMPDKKSEAELKKLVHAQSELPRHLRRDRAAKDCASWPREGVFKVWFRTGPKGMFGEMEPGLLTAREGRVSFATGQETVFEADRSEIRVNWPWWEWLGGGVHLTVSGKTYRLTLDPPPKEHIDWP
jgi:hypothetical protein